MYMCMYMYLLYMYMYYCYGHNGRKDPIINQLKNKISLPQYKNKTLWYDAFVMTTIIADGISVSTFLCTVKTGTWRSKCNSSLSTQIFDETDIFLQGSEWWLPHVWNSTTYYSYLLKTLASSFLCYIQQLLVLHVHVVAVLHSFTCHTH